jgi:hypothetical protein
MLFKTEYSHKTFFFFVQEYGNVLCYVFSHLYTGLSSGDLLYGLPAKVLCEQQNPFRWLVASVDSKIPTFKDYIYASTISLGVYLNLDRLCALMVLATDPEVWVWLPMLPDWKRVHSASWVKLRNYVEEKVAVLV